MRRCSPRVAWAAAVALLLALPGRVEAGWSAPAELLESVYAEKLEAPEYFSVSGFVALERFAPVQRAQLEVVLTVGGVQRRTARVLPNAAWTFHGVPPGTHALDVVAPGYEMTTLRVDVSALQPGRIRFSLPLQPEQALRMPLVLVPTGRVAYKEPVVGWSLRYFLQNPMYLIIGVMAIFAVAMPRMMEGMDPEELKLMQEQMGKGGVMGLLSGTAEQPAAKPRPALQAGSAKPGTPQRAPAAKSAS